MKLIVDELPKRPDDCPFSRYGDGCFYCSLAKDDYCSCGLEYIGRNCEFLKEACDESSCRQDS